MTDHNIFRGVFGNEVLEIEMTEHEARAMMAGAPIVTIGNDEPRAVDQLGRVVSRNRTAARQQELDAEA